MPLSPDPKYMRALHFSLVTASSLLAGGALLLASAGAQTTVATNPVGFTTLVVTPMSGSTPGSSFVSLNMVRSAVYRALVPNGGAVTTSNGVTALVFPSGTFTNNQFNGTGNASYIELTNDRHVRQ